MKKVCRSREKVTCGSHSSFERGVSDQCRYSSGVFCLTEQVYTIQNHKSHWSHKSSSSLFRYSLIVAFPIRTSIDFPFVSESQRQPSQTSHPCSFCFANPTFLNFSSLCSSLCSRNSFLHSPSPLDSFRRLSIDIRVILHHTLQLVSSFIKQCLHIRLVNSVGKYA